MGDHQRLNNHHLGQDDNQNFQVPDLNLSPNSIQPNNPQFELTPSAYSSTSAYDKQLFGCRSCTRVFFSSQALGGHMNAHRKDTRAAFKKCNYKNKQPRKTAAFHVSGPSLHTLGLVGSHSLTWPEPSRSKAKFERRCKNESEYRVPDLYEGVPLEVTSWPRSFQADDSHDLDLNLRL